MRPDTRFYQGNRMDHHRNSRFDPGHGVRRRRYAAALALLVVLFASRVAAQLLQSVAPVPWLPASADFQGSALPYPVLLGAQLAILVAMGSCVTKVARTTRARDTACARRLRTLGIVYASGTGLRVAIGLTLPTAGPWFQAWISSAFHLVLATFLIVFAAFFVRAPWASNRQASA